MGEGADALIVTKYKIYDTLPAYLSGTTITSVKVIYDSGEEDDLSTENVDESKTIIDLSNNYSAFNAANAAGDKAIFVPWADYDSVNETWTSKYPNGAIIEVKYEATLTDVTNIGVDDRNDIAIRPYVDGRNHGDDDDDDDDDDDRPWDEKWDE